MDLGFTFRTRKNGEVEILHHGRRAALLRGTDAADFIAELQGASEADAQQVMARVTGNYKHGNERLASQHPRNQNDRRNRRSAWGQAALGCRMRKPRYRSQSP